MKLYLIRHASAEAHSQPTAGPDLGLTEKARARMVRAVSGLRKLDVQPELILASPLKAAIDTAALVSQGLGYVRVETLEELSPGSELDALVSKLRPNFGLSALALVGHQPKLGHLASFLLAGSPNAFEVSLRKGGVALLSGDFADMTAPCTLDWLLPPKVLRRI
jgi:phosphohistidine phosphatase